MTILKRAPRPARIAKLRADSLHLANVRERLDKKRRHATMFQTRAALNLIERDGDRANGATDPEVRAAGYNVQKYDEAVRAIDELISDNVRALAALEAKGELFPFRFAVDDYVSMSLTDEKEVEVTKHGTVERLRWMLNGPEYYVRFSPRKKSWLPEWLLKRSH